MKSCNRETQIKRSNRVELLKKYGLVFVIVIIIIAMAIVKPNFISIRNLGNVLRQVSINGFVAIGMTVVILLGGIDLSAGAVVGLSGMLTAVFAKNHEMGIVFPMLIGCAAGLIIGIVNGIVVAYIRIPPFIQTLGMMNIARGIVYIISDAKPISGFSDSFLNDS